MSDLKPILDKLKYSQQWLDYGLLDEAYLLAQGIRFDASDDKNTEHYRYDAFKAILSERTVLDDAILENIVHLSQLDADQGMGQAALILLVDWPNLTDLQLDLLYTHPAFSSPVVQRRIQRVHLLRQLRTSGLTNELFDSSILSRDEVVHRELLGRQDISRQQLERLREQGANKAIRNIAKQRLASKKHNKE
jgi:hypothetical protein